MNNASNNLPNTNYDVDFPPVVTTILDLLRENADVLDAYARVCDAEASRVWDDIHAHASLQNETMYVRAERASRASLRATHLSTMLDI